MGAEQLVGKILDPREVDALVGDLERQQPAGETRRRPAQRAPPHGDASPSRQARHPLRGARMDRRGKEEQERRAAIAKAAADKAAADEATAAVAAKALQARASTPTVKAATSSAGNPA